jgi:hypothetical protein
MAYSGGVSGGFIHLGFISLKYQSNGCYDSHFSGASLCHISPSLAVVHLASITPIVAWMMVDRYNAPFFTLDSHART